nr:lysozyme inhibitor LprI family protein [Burkholderia ubonensis]
MTKLAFLLLLLASATAFAEQTPADEISARSGLPASEVSALLADCDSNQTSMNFCAWRDQIVAERELQQVVDQQVSEHPERKAALEAKIAKWKKARDASCEKSARKEWGGRFDARCGAGELRDGVDEEDDQATFYIGSQGFVMATHPPYSVVLSFAGDCFDGRAVEWEKIAATTVGSLAIPILLDGFDYKLDDEFSRRPCQRTGSSSANTLPRICRAEGPSGRRQIVGCRFRQG